MKLKTYGIDNLVDWKAQINAGKAKVIIHFTGGAITSYGVTPAEYSTANPFFQSVIEGSDYFKSGRIKLLREIEVEDDAETKARKMRKAQREAAAQAAEEAAKSSAAQADVQNDADGDRNENKGANNDIDEADKEPEDGTNPKEESGASADGKTEVPVTCIEDAVEYLKKYHGYKAQELRSKVSVERAATQHGIVFVGL